MSEFARAKQLAEITASRVPIYGWDVEAGDVQSAAYLGALHAHQTFQEGRGAAYETWVIRCVRQHIFELFRQTDYLSRTMRRRAREDPENPVLQRPIPLALLEEEPPLPDESARVVDTVAVRQAMEALDEPEKTVLRLSYWEGWSYQRIALHLGRSHTRIGQLAQGGRDRLRALLSEPKATVHEEETMTLLETPVDPPSRLRVVGPGAGAPSEEHKAPSTELFRLTDIEANVAEWKKQGLSPKEIARELGEPLTRVTAAWDRARHKLALREKAVHAAGRWIEDTSHAQRPPLPAFPPAAWANLSDEQLIALVESGSVTMADLARAASVTPGAVGQRVARARRRLERGEGFSPHVTHAETKTGAPARAWGALRDAELLWLVDEEGLSYGDLAGHYGVARKTIYRRVATARRRAAAPPRWEAAA